MDEQNKRSEVLAHLQKLWDKNPDLRFFQLMSLIETRFSINKNPFYVEDNEVLEWLKKRTKGSLIETTKKPNSIGQI